MTPIPAAQSLIDNVESQISLGLISLREGEDNFQGDLFPNPDGSGTTTGSLVRPTSAPPSPAPLFHLAPSPPATARPLPALTDGWALRCAGHREHVACGGLPGGPKRP